ELREAAERGPGRPLRVQHRVHHDAVRPGAEARSRLELRDAGHHPDQRLLRQIGGLVRVAHHPERYSVHPRLVPRNQRLERAAIARGGKRRPRAVRVAPLGRQEEGVRRDPPGYPPPAITPPSTGRTAPVIHEASSPAKKRMALTTSRGCPIRPKGW